MLYRIGNIELVRASRIALNVIKDTIYFTPRVCEYPLINGIGLDGMLIRKGSYILYKVINISIYRFVADVNSSLILREIDIYPVFLCPTWLSITTFP